LAQIASIDNEKLPPSEDIWSFDSDDVIEISLTDCPAAPNKASQSGKN